MKLHTILLVYVVFFVCLIFNNKCWKRYSTNIIYQNKNSNKKFCVKYVRCNFLSKDTNAKQVISNAIIDF